METVIAKITKTNTLVEKKNMPWGKAFPDSFLFLSALQKQLFQINVSLGFPS